jgi:hypothetical protein
MASSAAFPDRGLRIKMMRRMIQDPTRNIGNRTSDGNVILFFMNFSLG